MHREQRQGSQWRVALCIDGSCNVTGEWCACVGVCASAYWRACLSALCVQVCVSETDTARGGDKNRNNSIIKYGIECDASAIVWFA